MAFDAPLEVFSLMPEVARQSVDEENLRETEA